MSNTLLATPQYVRLDLFPASVTLVGEDRPLTDRGRVVITDQHFYLFSDTQTGPVIAIAGTLYDSYGTATEGYHAVLDDERDFFVRRSRNCGCGSRLRGFRLFPGVPYYKF